VCLDTGWDRDPRRGPAIDVFINLGGDRCWNRWQRPLGSPPSTSSLSSVVATAGPTGSTPQGAHHHRLLQPRWWPLSDPPNASPRRLAIDVFFKLSGGHCRTHRQCPLGGPPSTSSSTSVVAVAGPTSSAPQGAHHRRLATSGSHC
jgi:hypothetical protein